MKEFLFVAEGNKLKIGTLKNDNNPDFKHTVTVNGPVKSLLIRDEEGGISIFVNDKPVIYCEIDASIIDIALWKKSGSGRKVQALFECETGIAASIIGIPAKNKI